MARALKDLGVPAPILGKMVVTPADSIAWLTPDDLRSMGSTMTGKPAQVHTEQNAGQMPMQIDPSAKAVVPDAAEKETVSWDQIVQGAITLSSSQNNGKPLMNRGCQPELKMCSTAIFLKAKDGTSLMVRRAEDVSGKTVRRDICSFNNFDDVRTCTDFDTGKRVQEMQNERKEWVTVGE
jgi:hypothetical protein